MGELQVRETDKSLPFDRFRQKALLGHLLTSPQFFKRCKEKIQPEWFLDWPCSKVWQGKQNFFKKYQRIPTLDELKASEDWRLETQQNRTAMNITIEEALQLRLTYGLDTLVGELTDWLHTRAFVEGSIRSTELYNQGKTKEAFQLMTNKLEIIKNTSFEDDVAYDFSNMAAVFEKRKFEIKNALTFGISAIDKLILPMGDGTGGLLPGDTTLIIGATNAGKSTYFATIAAANIRRGKDVLYFTHEGVDDDIAEKIMCSLLNRNKAQLYEMSTGTEEEQEWFHNAEKALSDHLVYIAMDKPATAVEDVISTINRRQEEWMATHDGKGFDLLIDDYPQKLGSTQTQYGQFQKRNLDEYVYGMFVASALEHKFHCVVGQQANRTANKINRGQKGSDHRLLNPEDANESSGPAHQATNTFTINRSPDDERRGIITFYMGKSRSSEKGWAICCRSNYGNAITHSDSLGCCWYRGDVPLGDAAEYLMLHNMNKEIPYKEWRGELDKK
jgi:replicative DNA helicase